MSLFVGHKLCLLLIGLVVGSNLFVHGSITAGNHHKRNGLSATHVSNVQHSNNKQDNHSSSSSSKKERTKIHDWNHLGLVPPTTPASDYNKGGRARCAMPEPTKEKMMHDNAIVEDYKEMKRRSLQGEEETLVVETCFHVIRPEGDTDDTYLDADMIQLQLDGLNQGYSQTSCCDPALLWCNGECSLDTGIRFELAVFDDNDDFALTGATVDSTSAPNACHTRSFNDDWYNSEALSPDDIDMRFQLRRGGAHVLNIFFKGGESGLLGIAQFPSDWATQSVTDAVLVGDPYVIGAGDPTYGEGDTLTHEVGHWMGLFHTFQGGCSVGDKVGDTNAEKSAAYGCELGRDTCPGREGNDPIHNFMDYSDDHCLYEFTENQVLRMFAQFRLYRSGLRQDITLQNGVSSESTSMIQYELQTYVLSTSPGSRVECTASAASGGDIDMYMRDGAAPLISSGFGLQSYQEADCVSENEQSSEGCSMLSSSGLAYISLYAYRGTADAVVTCTGAGIETATQLSSGVFSAPFDVAPAEEKVFSLPISDPNERVVCFLDSPVDDDVTFYVRFSQPPDASTQNFDCSASGAGMCSVSNAGDASVLWATVTSASVAAGLSFACFASVPGPVVSLSPNLPSQAQSLNAFEEQTYLLEPPSGSIVTCQTNTVGGGDGNMFLRWGAEPELGSATFDCSVFDMTRSCTVTDPGLGTPLLYVTVETFASGLTDLEVECSVSFAAIPLESEVPTSPFDLFDGATRTFSIGVRRGDNITCELTADNPAEDTVDLFVNFDEPTEPSLDADCFSLTLSGNEECVVQNTESSTELYVVVQSFPPSATGIVLVCTISSPTMEEIGDAVALIDGISSEPFSLSKFELETFTLEVEPGARTTCLIEGFDGDADLYLRYNAESDLVLGLFDCFSADFGSFENCTVRDSGFGSTLFATVEAFEAFTDLTITCTNELLGPPIMLDDGETSGPHLLVEFEILDFTIPVEAGDRVFCSTTGIPGRDTDLILRLGQEVNLFDDDCYSETLGSSEETCAVAVPNGIEVLWIALVGYSPTDEVFLSCSSMGFTRPEPIALVENVPSNPISLDVGLSQSYTYTVSPQTRVTCQLEPTMSLSMGDADLYLRLDEEPDLDNLLYDCISADTGSFESCSVDVPAGVSTVWATILAYSMFENVAITCRSEEKPATIQLNDGQDSDPLSLGIGLSQTYQLGLLSEGNNVVCQTRLLVDDELADADLYVRIDAEPDLNSRIYDCASLDLGSVETCIVSDIGASSSVFATVEAFSDFNDLILTCSSYADSSVSDPLVLDNDVASDPIQLNTNQVQDFTFDTTGDASCILEGTTGDADLFLRWTDPPELDVRFPLYDCASENFASNEACSVVNPGDATILWARVLAFEGFNDVSITCASQSSTTPAPVTVGQPTPAPVDVSPAIPSTVVTEAPVEDPTISPVEDPSIAPAGDSTIAPVAEPSTTSPVTEVTPAPAGTQTTGPTEEESGTSHFSSYAFGLYCILVYVLMH